MTASASNPRWQPSPGAPDSEAEKELAYLFMAGGPMLALGVSLALVPFRALVGTPGTVLILTAIVLLAARGGRGSGALTALTVALSFNFFHAPPYYTLRIDGLQDIVATGLLFALGLLVAEIGVRGRVSRRAISERATSGELLAGVLAAGAEGAGPDDLWPEVAGALRHLLRVEDVRHVDTEPTDLAVMEHSGRVPGDDKLWTPDGWALPAAGVALPVRYAGRSFGWIVIDTHGRRCGSVPEERRAAVAFVDVWASACHAAAVTH